MHIITIPSRVNPTATIALAVLCMTSTFCFAQDMITVEVASGRSFTGFVDQRTDDERLWLRYGTESTTVIRPIAWERVVGATHNGTNIASADLPDVASSLKSSAPQREFFASRSSDVNPSDRNDETFADRAKSMLSSKAKIKSVDFDAGIANWDGDVEADGIVLDIMPMSAAGEMVPVRGTLTVELTALEKRSFQDVPRGRGQVPRQIARWSKMVKPEDLGPAGVKVSLPFQQIHPEFDTGVHAYGLVHVKLIVPGHGVFEASVDAVRIRPFAPTRDYLERSQGTRFFTNERTGRN